MARSVLLAFAVGVSALVTAAQRLPAASPAQQFQEAVTMMEARGDCRAASPIFAQVASASERALAARALVFLGVCQERLAHPDAAATYRRVIERFPDQRAPADEARRRLAAMPSTVAAARPTVTVRAAWPARPADMAAGGGASADGRVLAYLDVEGGVSLADLKTGLRLRQVVQAGEGHVGWKPVPSPDGTQVVYSWEPSGGRPVELRVSQSRARASRVLLRAEPGETLLVQDWRRPDQLLVERTTSAGLVLLLVVRVGDGQAATIATLPQAPRSAKQSPDGRFVAYDVGVDGERSRDVVVVSVAGGTPSLRVSGPADDFAPGWTPDGDALLFVSDRAGAPGLWRLPVRSGRERGSPVLLVRDLGAVIDFAGVTADGAWHYNRQVGLVDVHVQPLDAAGRPSGMARETRQTHIGDSLMPDFAADGHSLVYISQMSRGSTLERYDLASGTLQQISTPLLYVRRPMWSPDGGMLVVRGVTRDARFGFLRLDPVEGHVSPLVTVPASEETSLGPGTWAADSTTLAYVFRGHTVRRFRPSSNSDEAWFAVPAGVSRVVALESAPTDDRIAMVVLRGRDAAVIVRSVEGAWHDVFIAPAPQRLLSLAWLPDGEHLVFTKTDGQTSNATLYRVHASGGEPENLGLTADGLRDLTVSPDGRHMAWTAGYPRREAWVLEHFLPGPSVRAR